MALLLNQVGRSLGLATRVPTSSRIHTPVRNFAVSVQLCQAKPKPMSKLEYYMNHPDEILAATKPVKSEDSVRHSIEP
jgi:hypothetical protein